MPPECDPGGSQRLQEATQEATQETLFGGPQEATQEGSGGFQEAIQAPRGRPRRLPGGGDPGLPTGAAQDPPTKKLP